MASIMYQIATIGLDQKTVGAGLEHNAIHNTPVTWGEINLR